MSVTRDAIVTGARRWQRFEQPFPYVVATEVFHEVVYKAMEEEFRGFLSRGVSDEPLGRDAKFSRAMGHYDAYNYSFSDDRAGAFEVLYTEAWCDLIAKLFRVDATRHIDIGLHHHLPGSASGWPHNDLAPGWFPDDDPVSGRYTGRDPHRVDYQTGEIAGEGPVVEEIRAVALLIYLCNEPWRPGDGGETALFHGAGAGIAQPAATIPPINNTMLVFECTPFSFHTFLSNRRTTRNSLVMWLHRPKSEVVDRWTPRPIVYWRGSH